MEERLTPLVQRAVLEIVSYGYQTRTDMEQVDRVHDFYIMSYLKEGEALLRIYGQDIVTKAGSVILIPSGVKHDHIKTSDTDAVFLWWHFNFVTSWQVDLLRLIKFPIMVQMQDRQDFEEKFLAYLDAIGREQTIPGIIGKNARALDVLACLLENFLRSDEARIGMDIPDVFFQILEDVTTQPAKDISLELLSAKYHLNPTYLSNKFKEYFGIPPIFLHRRTQIETAKDFLLSSAMPVGEIASRLGFHDTATFTRFFTDKVGCSPSRFRNQST